MQTITEHSMKHITTDEMNDIIQGWIEAELPTNPAGYEDPGQRDALRDAQGKRFEAISNMDDEAFRALYRAKTGRDIGPMNTDGSYTEIMSEAEAIEWVYSQDEDSDEIDQDALEAAFSALNTVVPFPKYEVKP